MKEENKKLNTKLIIPILIVVIIVGVIGIFALYQSEKSTTPNTNLLPTQSSTPTLYTSERFSISIPAGWVVQKRMPGSIFSMSNPKEEYANPQAQKLNFKSFISVSEGQVYERSLDQITDYIIKTEINSAPGATILSNTKTQINNTEAQILEASLTHQNLELTILLTIIKEKDNYFLITAKTPASKWLEYKNLFHQTTQSFKGK